MKLTGNPEVAKPTSSAFEPRDSSPVAQRKSSPQPQHREQSVVEKMTEQLSQKELAAKQEKLDRPKSPSVRSAPSRGPSPLRHEMQPTAYGELDLAYRATYAVDPEVDERVTKANQDKEDGHTDRAVAQYKDILADLGPTIAWEAPSLQSLQSSIETSLVESRDPANSGEALLEMGLAIQQRNVQQAITMFSALENHREKLMSTSQPAPLYNRACCRLESEHEPSAEDLRKGMSDLLDSLAITLTLRDEEDLKATQELLPRTNGSLWRLHAMHAPFMKNIIAIMEQAAPGKEYDATELTHRLSALRPD